MDRVERAAHFEVPDEEGHATTAVPHDVKEISEKKRKMRAINYTWATLLGLLSSLACMFAFATAVRGTKPRRLSPNPKRPILLVHGYLSHGTHWIYHRWRLERAQVGPVYTINLGSPFHNIESYAQKLQQKAKVIAKETSRNDLILIGHSMGGIISAYYALHLAPKGSVTDLITLGSPWRGSQLAHIGLGACTKQMRIDSPFLDKLFEQLILEGEFRLYQMASVTDLIVRPLSRSMVKHHRSKTSIFPRIGHVQFLFSPSVSSKIIAHLSSNR